MPQPSMPRSGRRAAAAVAGLLALAVAGFATPSPATELKGTGEVAAADRDAMAQCLGESGRAPSACIGSIALVCARRDSGDRRKAEIACSRREVAVWRERMTSAIAALDGKLDGAARTHFAAVQQAWESYADLNCSFISQAFPASPRAAVFEAGCELREVAERTIHVERLLRRLSETR